MKITPYFRWYDLWIGIYIDTKNSIAYVGLIPMFGLKITFNQLFCKHDYTWQVDMTAGVEDWQECIYCGKQLHND